MNPTDSYVQQACRMPAMPEVAQRLLESFNRDNLSLQEVAGLVGRDQVLSAKVLRMANSARYSPTHDVDTLRDAAATLGLRNLRDLTLAACMTGAFPVVDGMDRMAFWRSTLAVAAYAQVLARYLDADEDVAYVAGLMLRTGQILMAMVDPGYVSAVAEHAVEVDSRIGFEQAMLGCSHPDVTAELARHWQFPMPMVEAFTAAADPMATHHFCRLAAALRLASVIADCREQGVPVREGLLMAQPELVEHVNLDLDWLEAHLPDHRLATAGVEAVTH